jgi:tetratricopeptide (TPR) repeat protein
LRRNTVTGAPACGVNHSTMKVISLIISLILFIAGNALACDEEKPERDCSKGSEYSWNPSNADTTARLNRFYSLEDLISAEYEKGNYEAAVEYINEYLALAAVYEGNWNYGNAIHDGYRYLGLISYDRGDLDEAAEYLKKSSESTGSPQLDTFGPELDLASLLLQEGKVEEVSIYLKGIRKFWEMDNGAIDSWLEQINNGERPELSRFGDHRMTLAEKVVTWLSLLWPVLISFIIYFIYRSTLSVFRYLPASILLTYIVLFASSFSSYFLLPPVIDVVSATLIPLTLYVFTAIFSFVIPGLAAFCLTRVGFLHVQPGSSQAES